MLLKYRIILETFWKQFRAIILIFGRKGSKNFFVRLCIFAIKINTVIQFDALTRLILAPGSSAIIYWYLGIGRGRLTWVGV